MIGSKVLLLDVDGVVLQNRRVLSYVKSKVTNYVRANVPGIHSLRDAEHLNRVLYTSYGHTHTGLKAIYGKSAPSLENFNQMIYDEDTLNFLVDSHHLDRDASYRAHDIKHLLDVASIKDVPVYLFSNAPGVWCNAVVDTLALRDYFPSSDQMLCGSHPVFQNDLLKPDPRLYKAVAGLMNYVHRDRGDAQILLVDDSWANLRTILHDPNWSALYFPAGESVNIVSPRVKTVHSMTDVIGHLD